MYKSWLVRPVSADVKCSFTATPLSYWLTGVFCSVFNSCRVHIKVRYSINGGCERNLTRMLVMKWLLVRTTAGLF